jgi:hypothetical protein
MFLILGGCIGVLYFVGCISRRSQGMTFEEWEYKQNNKSTKVIPLYDQRDDWYRYM